MALLPERVRDQEVIWKDEALFAVLEMLDQVVRVDISAGTRSHEHLPRNMVLFPNARFVSLGGIMRRGFVDAILLARPQMEPDENGKGKGRAKETELAYLNTLHLHDLQEETNPPAAPVASRRIGMMRGVGTGPPPSGFKVGFFEPMQHILTPELHDRCRNLHRISIRVYALSERGTSDDELWAEWATFLREVKPKEVVFDCDRTPKWHGRGGGSALRFARLRETKSRAAVANDRRFGETLLPVLRMGWEGLERVEIRGVGESIVKELQALEERDIEVVFDENNEEGYKWQRDHDNS